MGIDNILGVKCEVKKGEEVRRIDLGNWKSNIVDISSIKHREGYQST